MKAVIVITDKSGQTSSVTEHPNQSAAVKVLESFGWKRHLGEHISYTGAFDTEYCKLDGLTATIYGKDEWEASYKFAY